MAEQNDGKQKQTLSQANPADAGTAGSANIGGNPGSQHNDWGHSQAGAEGSEQSGGEGRQSGAGGNIGGVPGSQHNDWGHSPVETGGNLQSGHGDAARSGQTPRQGVMPGEEMGHLQRGRDEGGKNR